MSNQPLSGQTAVVTGSSSGIGRAIGLALGKAGANVFVHARTNRGGAVSVVEEISKFGVESEFALFDLAQPDSHTQLVSQAWDWREIDIWVNNAGADVLTGAAADLSFQEKSEIVWKVDVAATMNLSRDIGARMKTRGSGVILNMGWDQAAIGMAGDSGEMFAASKGAVMAFSRSLAKSLAPKVRVNCLAPGWIRTAWGADASDYWQSRAVGESLLARWGTPTDVANMACFLASPAAEFITGQVVNINGGAK